jgi:hypothetical protein
MLSIGLDLTTSSNGAEPQSMPGYESIHGSVTFTVATLLLLAGLLTIWGRSKEPKAIAGVADQYGDTSLAIGYYIALLGFFLAIVGASAMWQQRREAISA